MRTRRLFTALMALSLSTMPAWASSHREAPFIAQQPKLDGTDFYLFNSYETGRTGFVTMVANYLPLQDAYGGPNYFTLDPKARYDINIDSNGDAKPDISFQFRFNNNLQDAALNIGGKLISIPLFNFAPTTLISNGLNVNESFTVNVVRGNQTRTITNATGGGSLFTKPADNIGQKSFPDYVAYANQYLYTINIPGCPVPGRMFVGQRKDPFVVNLGEVFDLVNLNPLGPVNSRPNIIDDKNVTSLILEVSASCLTAGGDPVIGGWTVSSAPANRVLNPSATYIKPASETGPLVQQSRLANPLVNEVVIGLKDKNLFNASRPQNDAQFADYVTNPTLPALIEALFGVTAPTVFPRNDLVQVFLTGVPGLNQPRSVVPAEMMRLNTSIPAVAAASQNNLGVIGGDLAGYPNGRRPGDDVVDISLRAVMGVLLPLDQAPSGQLPYTDGAFVDASFFDQTFPYIKPPLPGSPAS
ncbi:DUF4331 domain-containing protein [Anthocerotibacter panamensis]|uniref:DUF4331 domain-containing protein n=1 Tax=Anthocerotibacter panamensis TaxID=2857077 RepID=UPI001FD9E189|nr:DUF4331 domain-containing protein [Anthocerotibacter panamensis]